MNKIKKIIMGLALLVLVVPVALVVTACGGGTPPPAPTLQQRTPADGEWVVSTVGQTWLGQWMDLADEFVPRDLTPIISVLQNLEVSIDEGYVVIELDDIEVRTPFTMSGQVMVIQTTGDANIDMLLDVVELRYVNNTITLSLVVTQDVIEGILPLLPFEQEMTIAELAILVAVMRVETQHPILLRTSVLGQPQAPTGLLVGITQFVPA